MMKSTKRIFFLEGEEKNVSKCFKLIEGFKAVTVVRGIASFEQVQETFANNKNLVCKGLKDSSFANLFNPIRVYVTDGVVAKDAINVRDNIVRQFMEIASRENIDIGDHISNATTEGPSKKDCLFCKLLAGHPVHEQASLYETDNFLVVPGSGAFVDGYLMILPKAHIMSCAELNDEQMEELKGVMDDVKFILKSIYGSEILIWENGSGSGGKGKPKTSIVHAHVHVCPSTVDVLKTTKMTGVHLNHIEQSKLQQYRKNSYLFVIDYDNEWYISSDPNLYIPRQYIRQILALGGNIEGNVWDWRRYPFWNNVEKSGETFLQFVRDNFETLSTRIQKATERFL